MFAVRRCSSLRLATPTRLTPATRASLLRPPRMAHYSDGAPPSSSFPNAENEGSQSPSSIANILTSVLEENLDGVPPAPDYPYYPPDEAYEPEQHYSEDGHSDSSSPFSESSTSLAHDFQQFKPPPAYRFHCNSTKNNTISSFTDPHGNMLAWYSGGSCGFRKRNRSGYEAGYQCAVRMFAKIEEMGKAMPMSSPMRIDLFCRGFGQGREALFKALTTAQGDFVREWIVSITDRTPIKIGGTRAKKVKRR